jgi:hypothetical protein
MILQRLVTVEIAVARLATVRIGVARGVPYVLIQSFGAAESAIALRTGVGGSVAGWIPHMLL